MQAETVNCTLVQCGTIELATAKIGTADTENSSDRGVHMETGDCTLGQWVTDELATQHGSVETDSWGLGKPRETDCREQPPQFLSGLVASRLSDE